MATSAISRRTLLQHGGAALAGLSVLRTAGPAYAFQTPGNKVCPQNQPPRLLFG